MLSRAHVGELVSAAAADADFHASSADRRVGGTAVLSKLRRATGAGQAADQPVVRDHGEFRSLSLKESDELTERVLGVRRAGRHTSPVSGRSRRAISRSEDGVFAVTHSGISGLFRIVQNKHCQPTGPLLVSQISTGRQMSQSFKQNPHCGTLWIEKDKYKRLCQQILQEKISM